MVRLTATSYEFGDQSNPELLAEVGLKPGELTRQVSLSAFDEQESDFFEFVEPPYHPNKEGRAYYIGEDRFTPSQFRRLSRSRKVEAMSKWFLDNYEDPAVRTPYESGEGGYQWIWGGPYEAHEEMGDDSYLVMIMLLTRPSAYVTRDGLFNWAPKEREEDYAQNDELDDGTYSIDAPLPDISEIVDDDEETQFSLISHRGKHT